MLEFFRSLASQTWFFSHLVSSRIFYSVSTPYCIRIEIFCGFQDDFDDVSSEAPRERHINTQSKPPSREEKAHPCASATNNGYARNLVSAINFAYICIHGICIIHLKQSAVFVAAFCAFDY